MASITKRGDSYRIKVSCGYDTSGKQVVQTMTYRPENGMTAKQIEKEVNRQAVLFEQDCLKGNLTATIKFQDFAQRWFQDVGERTLKGNTIYHFHNIAPKIYAEIGHLRLDKVTPRHIQFYILKLTDTPLRRVQGTYSTSTVTKYLNFISAVFNYAVKLQLVERNPCRNVYVPKKEMRERVVYTVEQFANFMETLEADAAKEPEKYNGYVLFFTLAVYTGFRKGELLGLEWRDIDFKSGMVTVNRASYYTPERGIYTDSPKSEKSIRSLKFPTEVLEKLAKYRTWQEIYAKSIASKWKEYGRLLTAWDGSPLSPNAPGGWLHDYLDYNGLPPTTIHAFRHLNASLLISSGVDVRTVQACLGHSTAITTLNIYAHSFQEQQVKAMDAVADAIKLNTPKKTAKRKKKTQVAKTDSEVSKK
jgi:integrase